MFRAGLFGIIITAVTSFPTWADELVISREHVGQEQVVAATIGSRFVSCPAPYGQRTSFGLERSTGRLFLLRQSPLEAAELTPAATQRWAASEQSAQQETLRIRAQILAQPWVQESFKDLLRKYPGLPKARPMKTRVATQTSPLPGAKAIPDLPRLYRALASYRVQLRRTFGASSVFPAAFDCLYHLRAAPAVAGNARSRMQLTFESRPTASQNASPDVKPLDDLVRSVFATPDTIQTKENQ